MTGGDDRRMYPSGVASVSEALDQLEADEDWEHRHGQEEMRWRGWTEVVDPLVDRLDAERERTRGRAVQALGWVEDERAFEPVLRRLRVDDSTRVRRQAAAALGAIGGERAVEPLVDAFDREPFRSTLVSVIGAAGGIDEVRDLVAEYDGPDEESLRRDAVGGIAQRQLSRDPDPAAIDAVVDTLHHGTPAERAAAAFYLRAGDDRRVRALVAALDDDDPEVRAFAAQSLGHVFDAFGYSATGIDLDRPGHDDPDRSTHPVASVLLDALSDPRPEVRDRAARALRGAPDDPAVDRRLRDVAETDPDGDVRSTAERSLASREPG